MIGASPEPPGVIAAAKELAEGIVTGARDRLALFAVELEEEKFRLMRSLAWAAAGLFAAFLAVVFLCLALVSAVAERARPAVLAGLGVACLAAFVIIFAVLRRARARKEPPFSSLLDELAHDRAVLRGEED